ncbi:PstS family phosphate ABC transporter substrate-binding protein [Amycolatopsis lurida]
MGIGQLLQSLAELLSSDQGSLLLGIAALAAIGAPLADRYLVRRKRIQFRVLYNSKIGLNPVDLNGEPGVDPELQRLAQLLDRLSVVVIRIRNTGGFDIGPDDFDTPIAFTFGRRIVWDARISEASDPDLRKLVRENMEFFSTGVPEEGLSELRRSMADRLRGMFGAKAPVAPPPQWHGVRLSKLSLKAKEKFKLVVVLREPDDADGPEITKEWHREGRITGGRIKDEKKQRRLSWPVITVAVGVLLTGALLATLLTAGSRPDLAEQCAEGSLGVEGSSAFEPIMRSIAAEYTAGCSDAAVATRATGSNDGIRALNALPPERQHELAVLSDGIAGEAGPELVSQKVAVVVYGVVVNASAGVDGLTADQLRGIYEGRWRDWKDVRGGESLPIRIVGRGQESGSRQVFEGKVLGGDSGRISEGVLSSDSCEEATVPAPTTRCERSSTAQVLEEVAATPGAIGYADAPAAKAATARDPAVVTAKIDGRYPDFTAIEPGYPFWTIEYLYTKGVPKNDTLLKKFVDYLGSDTARAELQDAGYTPCVGRDGFPHPLCVRGE